MDLQIGEKVRIAGRTWTIIPGGLALCDGSIGERCFREDWKAPDANNYEASDVRKFLEGWAQENGLLPREISAKDIVGITIPSKEEYLEARDVVPKIDDCWWLRSPGYLSHYAAYVLDVGGVLDIVYCVVDGAVSVRPALRLDPESCDLQIGEKIRIAGLTWTVIPGDLALCNSFIGEHCFRKDCQAPDANKYEASDVKMFIEGWARENGLLPKEINQSDVTGITLLSKEEYEAARDIVPRLDGWWWLRSPGFFDYIAAFVYGENGYVHDYGFNVIEEFGVRPALRLNPESGNFQIGKKVHADGLTWTVIPGNLALCDGFIGKHCFRKDYQAPDANKYEASDVRKFIEAWALEKGIIQPKTEALKAETGKIPSPIQAQQEEEPERRMYDLVVEALDGRKPDERTGENGFYTQEAMELRIAALCYTLRHDTMAEEFAETFTPAAEHILYSFGNNGPDAWIYEILAQEAIREIEAFRGNGFEKEALRMEALLGIAAREKQARDCCSHS